MSELPAKRQLALQLAAAIADEIQEELILWFAVQTSYAMKTQIYALLGEAARNRIAQYDKEEIPQPLSLAPEANALLHLSDEHLCKVFISDLVRKCLTRSDHEHTLWLIKSYKDATECGLLEAREAIEFTLYEARQKAKAMQQK